MYIGKLSGWRCRKPGLINLRLLKTTARLAVTSLCVAAVPVYAVPAALSGAPDIGLVADLFDAVPELTGKL